MDLYFENNGIAPVLYTDRLTLRPLAAADCDPCVSALSDPEVARWLTGVPQPYSAKDFTDFLTGFIPDTHHLVWAMDAGDGLIGVIGIQPELGYWLAPDHHGTGLMTEAATRVINWYFAQTQDDLTSGYHLGNAPSRNVLRKLGFRDTHLERDVRTAKGDCVDIQRMALSQDAWLKR